MSVERALRMTAGAVVLISVGLAYLHSPYWLWLTAFVGANLLQSAFTNWCPAMWFYKKIGLRCCDVAPQQEGKEAPAQ